MEPTMNQPIDDSILTDDLVGYLVGHMQRAGVQAIDLRIGGGGDVEGRVVVRPEGVHAEAVRQWGRRDETYDEPAGGRVWAHIVDVVETGFGPQVNVDIVAFETAAPQPTEAS